MLDQKQKLTDRDYQKLQNKDLYVYRKAKEEALQKLYRLWIKESGHKELLLEYREKAGQWLENHLLYHQTKSEEHRVEKVFDTWYYVFLQYMFEKQYRRIKEYANQQGISMFGDLPFYVNYDSADRMAYSQYFMLDEKGNSLYQSAVPPDDFQEDGQLWGTPVYDWEALEKDHFLYWKEKIVRLADFFDYLRIDHFRGLEAYFRVPAGASDAKQGEWVKVPGDQLLEEISKADGVTLIAENLGFITPEVDYLIEKHHLPGMKIMQFSLQDLYALRDRRDTVYYSGTHDNQTLAGWIRSTYGTRLDLLREASWDLIKKIYASRSNWVILPLQDLLALDDRHRMNTPGTVENNWIWTLDQSLDTLREPGEKIKKLAKTYHRI